MYALRGQRDYQEDCGFAIELGMYLLIGIADGFGKQGESGATVSKTVVQESLRCIGANMDSLLKDPEETLRWMFASVDQKTSHFTAGSTFSLALIDREHKCVTLAALGDSIIAFTDADNVLRLFPIEDLAHRHEGLSHAFGDARHAPFKIRIPFIGTYPLNAKSVLIISSDGLYPVTPVNDIEAMQKLAATYITLVREGAGPQKLAEYAINEVGSPDNVTVGIYKHS
jgi:serine/threonine protein phosphatase PrpC